MADYKTILGYLATAISFGSYIPYFGSIFKGVTKPHAFSWFIWSVLTAIAFAAQINQHAGAGAWVTASTALACFAVFVLALFKGEKDFSAFDWWALAFALASMLLWYFTKNPTLSVVLVTVIDAVGFLPTYRKGYYKPFDEAILLYVFSTFKYMLGIIALQSFSLSTWLFPLSLVLTNGVFVILVVIRRAKLKNLKPI